MDQALDRIPIIVQHKHNGVETELEEICKSLHSQMQTPLSRDKDTSVVFSGRLAEGFESSQSGPGGVADAAVDGLVVHCCAAGEFGVGQAEG
jgi:hypothetical protein